MGKNPVQMKNLPIALLSILKRKLRSASFPEKLSETFDLFLGKDVVLHTSILFLGVAFGTA